jgi:hypothetical protein
MTISQLQPPTSCFHIRAILRKSFQIITVFTHSIARGGIRYRDLSSTIATNDRCVGVVVGSRDAGGAASGAEGSEGGSVILISPVYYQRRDDRVGVCIWHHPSRKREGERIGRHRPGYSSWPLESWISIRGSLVRGSIRLSMWSAQLRDTCDWPCWSLRNQSNLKTSGVLIRKFLRFLMAWLYLVHVRRSVWLLVYRNRMTFANCWFPWNLTGATADYSNE